MRESSKSEREGFMIFLPNIGIVDIYVQYLTQLGLHGLMPINTNVPVNKRNSCQKERKEFYEFPYIDIGDIHVQYLGQVELLWLNGSKYLCSFTVAQN